MQDPTLPPGFSTTFRERFWANVQKTDACWLWTGPKNSDGYGSIGKGWNQEQNIISAHRASWILHHGPIAAGQDVLHNCTPTADHKNCVNPEHLRLADQTANAMDATIKYHAVHKHHWSARLTPEQIAEIHKLFATGKYTRVEIGKMFGVRGDHVGRILSGKRWTPPSVT